MSVVDYKTFIATIRVKLVNEISDLKLVQQWFDRIITLEFLQVRKIIPKLINYQKEEVIEALKLENKYFKNVFNDNIDILIESFPNHFYSKDIITLLKDNITEFTNVEEISNFQEDFKDHERYTNFTIINRNLETKVDEHNITALTQIFTPKWICKYFAKETIDYQTDKFQSLKILDPCLGTGQILVEALNSLIKLYKKNTTYTMTQIIERIYSEQLYGFDIDEHAITLAKFIFTLKAYELSNELLLKNEQIKLNFILIKKYQFDTKDKDISSLITFFEKASLYGSLIRVPNLNYDQMINQTKNVTEKEFINMCLLLNQKYDVVLTNPPYMGRKILPSELLKYLNIHFEYGKSELYTAFMERCLQFLKGDGHLGMITLHTWMFIKSFSDLRKYILDKYQIKTLLHLGKNTFENLNAYNALASAFVIKNSKPKAKALFVDLTRYDDINKKELAYLKKNNNYEILQDKLSKLDNYQFLYWLTDKEYYHMLKTPKLARYCEVRQGLATGNNQRYIRFWWEVDKNEIGFNYDSNEAFLKSNKKYAPYNKGGDQTKWYSTSKVIIKFNQKCFDELKQKGNHLPSKEFYFKEGITWSLFGFNSFNVRYKEQGYVFDVSGSSLFAKKELQNYILAFLSSNVAFYFLSSIAPTVNFQVGNITSLPFVYDEDRNIEISQIVDRLISHAKYLDSQDELSWNFCNSELLVGYDTKKNYNQNLIDYYNKIELANKSLISGEKVINEIFNDIYNLDIDCTPRYKKLNKTKQDMTKELLSYLVGVVFGRYQIDGYLTKIDNSEYQALDLIIIEIKEIIKKYLSINALGEIEEILTYSIEDYFKKYFGKEHINKYHHLPIYWYKKKQESILVGYYHTLEKDATIDKEDGIKRNYLRNDLLYKLF